MLSRPQRLLAFARYLRRPTLHFLPLLTGFTILVLVGGISFRLLYEQHHLSFSRALFVTYALVFMEHPLPFPHHWLLQLFYVLLPPIGLVVILDGIVQYGLHIRRRVPTNPDWNRAMNEVLQDHVVLFGLGKAGIRTLQYLLSLGQRVCVLERDPGCPHLTYAHKKGVPVLIGDHRHAGIFEELNVKKARSIILATDDDLANIEMALDARKLNPDIGVALRVFDQELAANLKASAGIPLAVSTTAMAAPLFATNAMDPTITNAFEVDDRLLVIASVTIGLGSALVGQTVAACRLQDTVYVLSHLRGEEKTFRPDDSLELRAGDVLTVQSEPADLLRLQGLNRAPLP